MERRDSAFRPEKLGGFDTGQIYQEFRFADITHDLKERRIFFSPDSKVYLSSQTHENGRSYHMVFGRPMLRGDILHSFYHFLSNTFDQNTLALQIANLKTPEEEASRDVALLSDAIGERDSSSLSYLISERLTTLDYCWNQIKGNKRYIRQLQKEVSSETPRIVFAEHAEGLAKVMRNHPELWRIKTSRRNILNATRVRALSRLMQLGDSLREMVFDEELKSYDSDIKEVNIINRVMEFYRGIPLNMGNGKYGILIRSDEDLKVIDLGGGLHRVVKGREEAILDLFGGDKHLADVYPVNEKFVIPAISWEKSKLGARAASLKHFFYTGPSTVETMSSDERIRFIRTFYPWQINTLSGLMSLGISTRYEPLGKATNALEVVQLVLREKNHILNSPLIESAEKLATF